MRIVSGIYGGRKLEVPKGRDIRPTSDKIRGAVFNMLRSRGAVDGAVVIDAFCGTGALGLEALSQGAQSCIFIDNSRESLDLCRRNIEALGAQDHAIVMSKDATKLGAKPDDLPLSTLAFLDPPYNKALVLDALIALEIWLADGATIVIEVEKSFSENLPPVFKILDERAYGDTKILLLKKEGT